MRNLHIVLGDQLDRQSSVFENFDRESDRVWMAEVSEESTHVTSSKIRIALFLSAMRHFREELERSHHHCIYLSLDDPDPPGNLGEALSRTLKQHRVENILLVRPGDYRVLRILERTAKAHGTPLTLLPDNHFFTSVEQFKAHTNGRKQLRMEFFYRAQRQRHGVLMEDGKPAGGKWNFDTSNRKTFGRKGPGNLPPRPVYQPDATTRQVLRLVDERFRDHPGQIDDFNWPVDREQALDALTCFIEHFLPEFGRYQDAMWSDQPYLYHALISSSLNLKLLTPREVVQQTEQAYRNGNVPIEAAEGFIRQVIGWREYVRGIYWHYMPDYLELNHLQATAPLPGFYWSGNTQMNCLRQCIGQTLQLGYAHHIQRLMVTGLFALLLGVDPRQVHAWYLAVYLDAVEWVELPNTLGMSQYADGGRMASKPYVASGKYIQRMSNYCQACEYDPEQSTGDTACPFTTLYWDFLARHQKQLEGNPRMGLQLRNLERIEKAKLLQIRHQAKAFREAIDKA